MEKIFDQLDLRSLNEARNVSDAWNEQIVRYLRRLRSRYVGYFVRDINGLLLFLEITDCLITGSVALMFILRVDPEDDQRWKDFDLDICVPFSEAESLGRYLETFEGYRRVIRGEPDFPIYEGVVAEVVRYKNGTRQIDIIRSTTECAWAPIASFWSTQVQNAIGPHMWLCGYPELTFKYRALLNPQTLDGFTCLTRSVFDAKEKYERRGFQIEDQANKFSDLVRHDTPCDCATSPYCPKKERKFGDELCAMGSFELQEFSAQVPTVWTATWKRGGFGCGGKCSRRRGLAKVDTELLGL